MVAKNHAFVPLLIAANITTNVNTEQRWLFHTNTLMLPYFPFKNCNHKVAMYIKYTLNFGNKDKGYLLFHIQQQSMPLDTHPYHRMELHASTVPTTPMTTNL